MENKRKHSETEVAENEKKEVIALERPKRTLFGFKSSSDDQMEDGNPLFFRNKEKALVTCSRCINFRFIVINIICSI